MALVGEPRLFRAGLANDAAWAVEAGVVVVDDGGLVDASAILVHVGYVDAPKVRYRAVIGENSAAPFTAAEADSTVAEAVIDAAVETDMRTPIARVPSVEAASETPIARGPQEANSWGLHPYARDPVVTGVAIGPIARRPNVARG